MKSVLLTAFFLSTLLATSFADGLKWETASHDVKATLSEQNISVQYGFTNTSNASITITDTRSSCGCTVPQLEKKVYAPGENGTLDVIFDAQGKSGPYEKQVFIHTNEQREEPYELTLKVDIPRAVLLKPRVQIWKKGSEIIAKTYNVTFHDDFPVDLNRMVNRTKPNEEIIGFDYEIETIRANHEYKIHITPHSTTEKSQVNLIPFAEDNPKAQKVLNSSLIYAMVR